MTLGDTKRVFELCPWRDTLWVMAEVQKARVFRNGRSQAVRIPAAYWFKSDEVYVRRDPQTGALILTEKPFAPSLDEIYEQLDAAGASGFVLDRDSAQPDPRSF